VEIGPTPPDDPLVADAIAAMGPSIYYGDPIEKMKKQKEQIKAKQAFVDSLIPPTILHQSEYLVVVNKPPGWKVQLQSEFSKTNKKKVKKTDPVTWIPDLDDDYEDDFRKKQSRPGCLMTHLVDQKLGGGPNHRFVKPFFPLDPSETGLLVVTKSKRAFDTLYPLWDTFPKTYLAAVEPISIKGEAMLSLGSSSWKWLRSIGESTKMHKHRMNHPEIGRHKLGFTTAAVAVTDNQYERVMKERHEIMTQHKHRAKRRHLRKIPFWECEFRNIIDKQLIEIRIQRVTRHMIRAILSSHGIAVRGDTLYGASAEALFPDRSVALHGRTHQFPIELAFSRTEPMVRSFKAPIPESWTSTLGYTEEQIAQNEETKIDHSSF
jgi:23S rRNA-/tRNA-specific pseudouridylate synthase